MRPARGGNDGSIRRRGGGRRAGRTALRSRARAAGASGGRAGVVTTPGRACSERHGGGAATRPRGPRGVRGGRPRQGSGRPWTSPPDRSGAPVGVRGRGGRRPASPRPFGAARSVDVAARPSGAARLRQPAGVGARGGDGARCADRAPSGGARPRPRPGAGPDQHLLRPAGPTGSGPWGSAPQIGDDPGRAIRPRGLAAARRRSRRACRGRRRGRPRRHARHSRRRGTGGRWRFPWPRGWVGCGACCTAAATVPRPLLGGASSCTVWCATRCRWSSRRLCWVWPRSCGRSDSVRAPKDTSTAPTSWAMPRFASGVSSCGVTLAAPWVPCLGCRWCVCWRWSASLGRCGDRGDHRRPGERGWPGATCGTHSNG